MARYHARMNVPTRRLKMRHIAAGLLLLAFAVIGWYAVRLSTLKPGQPGRFNSRVVELVEASQSDLAGPNAWDDYLTVISQYEKTTGRLKSEASPTPPQGWSGQSWPVDVAVLSPATGADVRSAIEEVVAAHLDAGLFAAMERLSPARRYVRPIPAGQALFGRNPSDAGVAREIAKLARARMHLATDAGDEKAALSSFDQAMSLSEVVGRQCTSIEQLQSMSIADTMEEAARRLAAAGAISPAGLRVMLARLDAVRPLPLGVTFEAEWYTLLDTLEWTHSDDGLLLTGKGGIAGGPNGVSFGGMAARLSALTLPSKTQSVRMADSIYRVAIDAARLAPAERDAKLRSLSSEVEAIPAQYRVLRAVMPSFDSLAAPLMASDAEREGTKLTLAIAVFKNEKGRWPQSLAELTPEIVPAMPGWSYRVTSPGDTPDGRPYLLYHTGLDGVDNGGKANPFGAHSSWNAKYSGGHDYIVDQWNDEHK